jgi:hypothetical protein
MTTSLGRIKWSRVLIGGVLWALVYNLVWGAAWLGFMRQKWLDATAAAKEEFPWTPEVLGLWAGLTVPIGIAVVWFCASNRARYGPGPKPAVYASAALWVMMTVSMIVWAAMSSLPMGVIALDSVVNLGATVAATVSVALLHREAQVPDWAS